MLIYDNLQINSKGHLEIAGVDCVELAEEYGNPLYVMDENVIRANCRKYTDAANKYLPDGSMILYAGKALCVKGLYPIIESEGLGSDVVSPGEIFTVLQSGFDSSKLFFHGTSKTDWDINYGLDNKIGFFIVDNFHELEALDRIAKSKNVKQKILLRITVGIDPHTQEKINTGRIDSQFGISVDTGQAKDFVKRALELENIELMGFHSHIGSQIFESEPFIDQIDKLLDFAISIKNDFSYEANYFNLGGGFAVRYTRDDPEIDIDKNIKEISEHLYEGCKKNDYSVPSIILEPGRSIVATAGITLYKTTGVKEINGYLNYVTVDGGMTDNIRFALYNADYTIINASKAGNDPLYLCTIVGRCCESGDRIAENVYLSKPDRNDIIAVLGTGAYNYSMASNYNRVPKPAMVMIKDGKPYQIVRAQTFEDMISCEI